MMKRMRNVTIVVSATTIAAYVNHTPYRTTFAGINVRSWHWGRSYTAFVRAFAIGPFVCGRTDI